MLCPPVTNIVNGGAMHQLPEVLSVATLECSWELRLFVAGPCEIGHTNLLREGPSAVFPGAPSSSSSMLRQVFVHIQGLADKTIHCVFVFNEARKLAASPATRGRPHRACAAGWTSAGPCLPQASVLGDAMVYATAVLGEFAKRVTKPMMAS